MIAIYLWIAFSMLLMLTGEPVYDAGGGMSPPTIVHRVTDPA